MLARFKDVVKKTPIAYAFIYLKRMFVSPGTQNEEASIIAKLVSRFDPPKTFVEFGFSGWEFNCASLIQDWNGLLIDGDEYNIKIARAIMGNNIEIKKQWITKDSLNVVRDYIQDRQLGILSIDVDGNDYWFLQELIDLKPSIIIAEYNSSFGQRFVSVPYDPEFIYYEKHASRYYHGASLNALAYLTAQHGYSLVDVTTNGVNAFFVRTDLLGDDDIALDAGQAYREKFWDDGSRTSQQWETIKHLPLVDVTID